MKRPRPPKAGISDREIVDFIARASAAAGGSPRKGRTAMTDRIAC